MGEYLQNCQVNDKVHDMQCSSAWGMHVVIICCISNAYGYKLAYFIVYVYIGQGGCPIAGTLWYKSRRGDLLLIIWWHVAHRA